MINQATSPLASTPTSSKDETTEMIVGAVFLVVMPSAVIFATLYVRRRKRQALWKTLQSQQSRNRQFLNRLSDRRKQQRKPEL
jgi:hypothetical protein